MAAYLVVDIDVTDANQYAQYTALAPAAIAAHGGRYLVRGGAPTPVEGDWSPTRIVVLEFPTMADAKAFYDSPAYVEARAVRAGAATMRMVAVNGV